MIVWQDIIIVNVVKKFLETDLFNVEYVFLAIPKL